jgi:hypothetical protein
MRLFQVNRDDKIFKYQIAKTPNFRGFLFQVNSCYVTFYMFYEFSSISKQIKTARIMKIACFLCFIAIFLNLSSCCTKKDCSGAAEINKLFFYNYSDSELDSIKIYSYPNYSDFTEIVDSSFAEYGVYGEENVAYLNKALNVEYNHIIQIVNTGQVFTLSGFELEERGCNKCFPYRPEDDYYKVVKSFFLNGIKKEGNVIEISK